MVISLSETQLHKLCDKNVTEPTWPIPIKYFFGIGMFAVDC